MRSFGLFIICIRIKDLSRQFATAAPRCESMRVFYPLVILSRSRRSVRASASLRSISYRKFSHCARTGSFDNGVLFRAAEPSEKFLSRRVRIFSPGRQRLFIVQPHFVGVDAASQLEIQYSRRRRRRRRKK